MKVFISPQYKRPDKGEGGIRRVVEAQMQFLPEHGIEFVDDYKKADVVNCHATETVDHPNIVLSCHGLYWTDNPISTEPIFWSGWSYKANNKIVDAMKQARAVTSPSEWVAQSIRRGMLIDPFVCMHGIDYDDWVPAEDHGGYILWNKSRVDPICDPTPLNVLAKRLPNSQFVSTYAAEAMNVSLTGRLNHGQMKKYIQESEVYLATTRETGGIGTLEALSCGVPVVGWNWGGTGEIIVHGETGFLCEPGDYDGLVEGVEYCRKNRKRMSEAAREDVIARWGWKDRIQDYLPAFYHTLAEAEKEANAPAASIIVPAYNLDKYLPATIESVLAQDFDDWELIIVDDHSPDNCGAIADLYADKDKRIKVIHNKSNQYLAQARNIGIENSTGRYVMPLDADDMLHPKAIGMLVRALDQRPEVDIVTGSMEVIEPNGNRFVSSWPIAEPKYEYQINGHNMVPYASMFRRWVWERTGGYRRRVKTAEDADFWTRAMSYGAVPAKVTDLVTLIYRTRLDSMSHTVPMVDWTSWFPWSRNKSLTPYGASFDNKAEKENYPVWSYGHPEVSIIIPVGPGHDHYLQDVLDSVVAQTTYKWEVIVVNDTGVSWYKDGKLVNTNLRGFPFVKVIETEGKQGPAFARNRGIEASSAPYFILVDADDYLQADFVLVMLNTVKNYGGWAYSDWMDQNGEIKEADDWNPNKLKTKMLGPSTGIYPKEAWKAVGGIDEKIRGWEDWAFQLSLLDRGCCGSRVAYPGFVYRYDLGTQREFGYSNREALLKYIKENYGDINMACSRCGGGKKRVVLTSSATPEQKSLAQQLDSNLSENTTMVTVEYVGNQNQFRRYKSKVNPRISYYVGGDKGSETRKFQALPEDALNFSLNVDFNIIETKAQTVDKVSEISPLLSVETRKPDIFSTPVDVLNVDPKTISVLKSNGFMTVGSITLAHDSDLLALKHIGSARLTELRNAVDTFAG